MERIINAGCFLCALISEGLRRLAVKVGLEEKWETFTDWLKEDKDHAKMFAAGVMVFIALVILLGFYGCAERPDL